MGQDAPGSGPIRAKYMAAHLAHVEANMARLAVAGPLRNATGAVSGSLLVVHAEDEADARAFIAQDPYFKAGVWAVIEVRAFSAVAGDWVGGRAW
ncbi:YciI family protein [Polymorphobacter sp.]|uniref:YciI family protein n=1 Tax=Polymorphobacter sp. TaxID=1909290 RepID=UPI003F72E397